MSDYKSITQKIGGKMYTFRLGFEAIRRIQQDHGLNSFDIMNRFLTDRVMSTADELLTVIECCLEKIDGKNVRDTDIQSHAVQYLDDAGLQKADAIVYEVFLWGQIGNAEKKRLDRASVIQRACEQLVNSYWMISAKVGLLWVATLLISTTLTCLILTI